MKSRRNFAPAPVLPVKLKESPCVEIFDSSTARFPAAFLLKGQIPRDPQSLAARLASQFIRQNRGVFQFFHVLADLAYDGREVEIVLQAGTKIGALPLLSPTSGKPDYGLVIKPRFAWPGIGSMLGKMGWRVVPSLLQLPLLPRSDRNIPPWVLAATVLFRIKKLLECLERRFEFSEAELRAPRGSVKWPAYVTSSATRARFLHVPCRYPDLRDDRELIAAVHYTLRKLQASLESQRSAGAFVLQLISLCQSLLERVRSVPPVRPTAPAINGWHRGPLRTEIFREGLQAVEWTVEDRGLAGLGDLQGLPWVMSMEEFFEAWTETVAAALTRQVGGILRTGRKRETVAPLVWDSPYAGSQKYLVPDLILERSSAENGEKEVIIFDAKYKSHWEDLSRDQWGGLDEELRESHRADLFQILAYSALFEGKKVTCCLVYPCRKHTWESLKRRGLHYHKASLGIGKRNVNLVLAAIPMDSGTEEIVQTLITAVI
ncbi:MAG: McrC family protein [Firmicutes bacterium]|nr:McrC family protein [Bacillota bacterium]